ncbi:MAG: hypothetical protein ACPGSM_17995 [Thiolinea sp.]
MLTIYAGKQAQETIRQQGFRPDLFNSLPGASGGPQTGFATENNGLINKA